MHSLCFHKLILLAVQATAMAGMERTDLVGGKQKTLMIFVSFSIPLLLRLSPCIFPIVSKPYYRKMLTWQEREELEEEEEARLAEEVKAMKRRKQRIREDMWRQDYKKRKQEQEEAQSRNEKRELFARMEDEVFEGKQASLSDFFSVANNKTKNKKKKHKAAAAVASTKKKVARK